MWVAGDRVVVPNVAMSSRWVKNFICSAVLVYAYILSAALALYFPFLSFATRRVYLQSWQRTLYPTAWFQEDSQPAIDSFSSVNRSTLHHAPAASIKVWSGEGKGPSEKQITKGSRPTRGDKINSVRAGGKPGFLLASQIRAGTVELLLLQQPGTRDAMLLELQSHTKFIVTMTVIILKKACCITGSRVVAMCWSTIL
ncbi:hypothetical protein GLOTRDRAFT_93009 [Gloeophyllum trabeum ATCC 11539]|uniref:Uncharacterized protein n=1 Tax=Gloeophyllum trabeum (strain ATCC 11539 / FP-39264 / Madison 617) TaxID=670483 RepID=S7RPV6_GLOTA|nr:uncharacterized protein GLOTRDRAFT_93009 [Gloeophyllum trabeum ATCC 11539]EPQ56605.1 hypothetical protein GLOTRDRAFT_93009 [Gloeophyllum trabeum ATCC 11539]